MLNRRPYYRSVADWRLRNKPKPLAELTLFPSRPAQAHWRPVLEAGIEKVASVLQPCPTFTYQCVRQAGGRAKPKSDPKRMLCTVYLSSTRVLWKIYQFRST